MSAERPTVPGNPVRQLGMKRVLRSHVLAATLAVWVVVAVLVAVATLVDGAGATEPFRSPEVPARALGQALAQWWVVIMTLGAMVAAPIVVTWLVAGRHEQAVVGMWQTSLVRGSQIVRGTVTVAVMFVVLALLVTLPVPVAALASGGTSAAQLAVGAVGAVLCGTVAALVAMAVAVHGRRVSTTLVGCFALLMVPLGVTTVVHGMRATAPPSHHRADGALIANPLVGVADAAAPHAPMSPDATSGTAPLVRLRSTVRPIGSDVPDPWIQSLVGGIVVGCGAYVVAILRLRRVTGT